MPGTLGKHTPYYELVDAQGQAGCPICRLVHKATDRYLDSLLYEAVLDPNVRAKLKESRGFCSAHTEMLRRKPGRALGVALIYRDIIRAVSETVGRGCYKGESSPVSRFLGKILGRTRGRQRPGSVLAGERVCPACAIARKAERNNIELLLAHLQDERLHDAYAKGEGLCLPHFVRALEAVEDEESFGLLVGPQVARYRVMIRDLDEFIRKRDHRFRHEKYGEERDVWLRVLNAVVGGAGMGLSAESGGRGSPEFMDERS